MSATSTRSLAEHVADHARARPQAPALLWDGEAIGYGELGELAASTGAGLDQLPSGRPVGIRAKKSPDAIALILACMRAGLPFLLPSIELAPDTLAKLFAQAGTSDVISPYGERSQSATSLRALVED